MSTINDSIREIVKSYVSEKRFSHTLGVEREAYSLGLIFIPEKAEKLKLAGLLHDITKDFKTEKQLQLCDEYGIYVDIEHLAPKLLHSKTGCEFALRTFGDEIVDSEVYSGILYHTTGRECMSLFESIIYLADYIDETRKYEECVILRNMFWDAEPQKMSEAERIEHLDAVMLKALNMSIDSLINDGKIISCDTVSARNSLLLNKK